MSEKDAEKEGDAVDLILRRKQTGFLFFISRFLWLKCDPGGKISMLVPPPEESVVNQTPPGMTR